jgi:hypothetical protein
MKLNRGLLILPLLGLTGAMGHCNHDGDESRGRRHTQNECSSGSCPPANPVPEPGAAALLGVGALIVAWTLRRGRNDG